jgi:hypothetical protein
MDNRNLFPSGITFGRGGAQPRPTEPLADLSDDHVTEMIQRDPALLFTLLMDRYREERQQKERIKCPVCTKVHKPVREGQKSVCRHVSHNCLEIWLPAPCPICLEVSFKFFTLRVAALRCFVGTLCIRC